VTPKQKDKKEAGTRTVEMNDIEQQTRWKDEWKDEDA
jgi:hypothetical protein